MFLSTTAQSIFSDDRHGLIILDPSPFGDFVVRSVVPILATAHEVQETRGTTHAYVASGNLILVDVTDDENPEIDVRLNTPGRATGIQFRNDNRLPYRQANGTPCY